MQPLHSFSEKILELPRVAKRAIAVLVDVLLCLFTVALAYRLRLDDWIFPTGNQWWSYIASVALAIPIFIRLGLYRAIFRYVGWHALGAVTWACALYGLIYAAIFSVVGITLIPRTTGILQPMLLFLGIGASRAITRFWLGGAYATLFGQGRPRNVLIYGAGSAGRQLAAGLASSQEMKVVAFVDDDRKLHGSYLNGKRIGAPAQMLELIDKWQVTDVLLAIPSASRQRRNEIVDSLRGHHVLVRTLPGIYDLADGKVTVSDLRPLEIEDLLGRDAVPPDYQLMRKCIEAKTVLVTGAGGSIGSELCRQIVLQNPARLVLVEQNEYNLYAIDMELERKIAKIDQKPQIVALLASVQDAKRMDNIIAQWRPDTIYHAAAYKHVPLVEANPGEAIRNNVIGTRTVAELAEKYEVTNFVLISTDKAVRPPNIMGATKRVAEMILQNLAAQSSPTKFCMVRFGNVLGSSGSVVPLFREQLAAGGPITVTHPEITRYFMTIPEAAQLVIQAGAMAQGGEVFVLDMGEPVRIIDLARRMIELAGLKVREPGTSQGDIEIQITGLRPAEKLYEELLVGDNSAPTAHPKIAMAMEKCPPRDELNQRVAELWAATETGDDIEIRRQLGVLIPEITTQSKDQMRQ